MSILYGFQKAALSQGVATLREALALGQENVEIRFPRGGHFLAGALLCKRRGIIQRLSKPTLATLLCNDIGAYIWMLENL